MALIKPSAHRAFFDDVKQGKVRAALVYGGDVGGVTELARRIIHLATGGSDDPLSLTVLDEEILREDPARLADEAQSVSMFGGRCAIRVRAAGEAFARAMRNVLAAPPGGNMIIAEAGALKASSALRKMFEKEKGLAALPVYEDSARDIGQIVRETLRKDGLDIAPDALEALVSMLGADRAASRGELEKLALYCLGRQRVSLEDVQAICGDVSAHAMNDMIDAFFTGDARRGAALFSALLDSGTVPAGILASASHHVGALKALAVRVAAGDAPQQVVRAARPPVFFKRHPAMIRQLNLWPLPALERADASLYEATEQSRLKPDLAAQIAERCLLSLGLRAARAARR